MVVQDRRQLALQIRIGIFVMGALAAFLGFIYLLGVQARLFEARYDLVAEFTEVAGLLPGATVRLAGVQIGRVSSVTLPAEPGKKVRITLTIARRFADRIRKDSVARIETQGLLGDKLVELSLGSPGAPALKPREPIATRDPVELHRLASEGVEILKNVSALSANVNTMVESLGRITREVEHGKGWLHVLLYEEPGALRRLNALLARTERLLTEAERRESAVSVLFSAESGRAARRLLAAMESLGALAEKAKGSDSLLGALLLDPEFKGVADDLRVVARNFRQVSERLAQGKGVVGSLLKDEGESGLGQAAQDFKVAVANLRAVTDRLAAGEGTLGALLEDPTVYENLAAFLEGAQRSTLLRYLIRSTIEKGAK